MATLYSPATPQFRRPVQARRQRTGASVFLAVALGYLFLLPPQFNLEIAGSVIPPYRFLLLPSTLFLLAQGLRGSLRFSRIDFLVILAMGWIALALSMTSDFYDMLTSVVAQGSDILLAYFFGRATIRSLRDLRVFLLLMLPGVATVAAIMVIESITHTHIIQGIASQITGKPLNYRPDPRFGLMRARGPFPHPIGAGLYVATFIPLYWLSGIKRMPRYIGSVSGVATFFTVSSGAFLALLASIGLLVYNWLAERIANFSWRIFIILGSLMVFVLELGTNTGTMSFVIRVA
ncbi:MAG: hypothetical protein AAFS13_02835, partial [Pseudomonadota bacterium]